MQQPALLLTRPREQAMEFAAKIEARCPGAFSPIAIASMLEIVPEPAAPDFSCCQALLFTSRNGVVQCATRWPERHVPALCVGKATAGLAREHGYAATSADGDVAALASLAVQSYLPGAGTMLHMRGETTAGALTQALVAEGIDASEQIIYSQKPLPLSDTARHVISGDGPVVAPVFSPRTAALIAAATEHDQSLGFRNVTFVALSEAVARPLRSLGGSKIVVCERPEASSILDILQAMTG